MLSDPRSIAFVIELLQPQLKFRGADIQKLYGHLATESDLAYANINLQAQGAQMSTVHGQNEFGETSHSSLSFGPDRIQLREEWPRHSLDEFIDQSSRRVAALMKELAVPVFSVVQCTVRCLLNARGIQDSRELMSDVLGCSLQGGFSDFDRAPNLLGLRVAFPATGEDPAVHNVRVESFGRDARSLFLEEIRVANLALRVGDVDKLETAYRDAYEFLTDRVAAWLSHLASESGD